MNEKIRAGIDVSIIRCPNSKHIELVFESDQALDSEAFYAALRTFVDCWEPNADQLFRYHDQKFPHQFLREH